MPNFETYGVQVFPSSGLSFQMNCSQRSVTIPPSFRLIITCIISLGLGIFGIEGSGWSQSETAWQENSAIGNWNDYLPYDHALEIVFCGNTLATVELDGFWAVRSEHAVFLVRPDENSVQRLSTVQGMSGSNPSALAWDYEGRILIIGYTDGALDFFSEEGHWLHTLNDIRDSNLIGDKAVNALTLDLAGETDRVYASCGFGVVVINPREWDIRDTWYVQGLQMLRNVRGVLHDAERFIVWTDAGIFEAPREHPFLSAPEAWTRWLDVPLETGDYRHVIPHPDGSFVLHLHDVDAEAPDGLWVNNTGIWEPMPNWESPQVRAIDGQSTDGSVDGWRLAIADYNSTLIFNASWEPVQLDYAADGIPLRVNDFAFQKSSYTASSFSDLFIANEGGGLLQMDLSGGEADEHWVPEGPPTALVRALDVWNDNVWIASGGVDETWTSIYHKYGMYGLVGSDWKWIPPSEGENDVAGINDVMCVSIDPLNPDHVFFGTWEEGLLEVLKGELIEIYNPSNSALELADFGGSPRVGVGGVDFDDHGNLWITNAYAEHPLHVRMADGTFVTMDLGDAMGNDGWLGDVLAARNGYVWAIMPRGQGLLVYDTHQTPSDLTDDDWRLLSADMEAGGLASNYIHSIEEDLDGEIWIGTAAGPSVIYLPSLIFDSQHEGPVASQILIQQDGNYQLLLETEVIRSIAIDGGNRKWLGTQNSGLYLLSSDGVNQVQHFTKSNSPLLSNLISDIALNHRNGAVFIGTDKGLMSWRGEATNFVTEIDELQVYPNPVRRDFDGLIAIEGLAYRSTVHITSASGRWIATLSSEGGRAVWNGTDAVGQAVPHGVYLIFATAEDGQSAGATKLAIIR